MSYTDAGPVRVTKLVKGNRHDYDLTTGIETLTPIEFEDTIEVEAYTPEEFTKVTNVGVMAVNRPGEPGTTVIRADYDPKKSKWAMGATAKERRARHAQRVFGEVWN